MFLFAEQDPSVYIQINYDKWLLPVPLSTAVTVQLSHNLLCNNGSRLQIICDISLPSSKDLKNLICTPRFCTSVHSVHLAVNMNLMDFGTRVTLAAGTKKKFLLTS